MNQFAALLDRLSAEPSRTAKLRLIQTYLATTPDPDRGYALAALTGSLSFTHAKSNLIRTLIAARTDPVLFALSYDYVGDLSETVALMWPAPDDAKMASPRLSDVIIQLETTPKTKLPALLADLLDRLDETGRWALLKLITGGLRIGVSARLAKTAAAQWGGHEADEIEDIWHGLTPPYWNLFAWLDGRAPRPISTNPAPFRPVMLSHAIEESDLQTLVPDDFVAEWKWDGIRIQIAGGHDEAGHKIVRLYSRNGEDISAAFPDIITAFAQLDGAIDGELLVVKENRIQSFAVLQQRLNRKQVTPKLIAAFPAMIMAYDVLSIAGEDVRALPYQERRERLSALVDQSGIAQLRLSSQVPFEDWDALQTLRANPSSVGVLEDADAIEGCMIKRRDSPYLPGRPKGYWFKWKREPYTIDAVLMYAQRGHGKRSSFYSDYTFGVWRVTAGTDELVPVGKAYFGFTDAELVTIDRFVRKHTVNRFGPIREVAHDHDTGLVFEVAFEGLNESTRHKSGLAMRFPRIARLRWDKAPRDADRIETLEALIGLRRTEPMGQA